eukprot:CAMPEP_0196188824 /NCGR_PEP_ID=MMETSP0911-20130528/43068_1 /TAXON_ID=49265 /ORGANISM="Thalassiosira rotula, Strain GSO102" /LENGTH=60 /DNA_ID=CAMNT_0041460281 /DNA_START=146 /DNA_END=328 /DNA_ORIENTATION=-
MAQAAAKALPTMTRHVYPTSTTSLLAEFIMEISSPSADFPDLRFTDMSNEASSFARPSGP